MIEIKINKTLIKMVRLKSVPSTSKNLIADENRMLLIIETRQGRSISFHQLVVDLFAFRAKENN